MKKTDFRRILEGILVSKIFACSDVKLAEVAALMIECDDCPLHTNKCTLGCEITFYDAITKEATE